MKCKLHHNWLNKEPERFSRNYTGDPLALTDDCLVLGFYEDAKVIDLASQEIVANLVHQGHDLVNVAVITETWIITQNLRKVLYMEQRDIRARAGSSLQGSLWRLETESSN